MDWKNLIAEMMEAGKTQVEISQFCECSQTHISDIHRGRTKEPNYQVGMRLVELHSQATA